MVPKEPEDRSCLGLLTSRKCMAHIWFCPTSVVMMVSSSKNEFSSFMTFCGTMGEV